MSMKKFLTLLLLVIFTCSIHAEEGMVEKAGSEKQFDPTEIIAHHVADSHNWEVFAWEKDGEKKSITIPLPIILIDNGSFHFFMSSKFDEKSNIAYDNGKYYIYTNGEIFRTDSSGSVERGADDKITNYKPWDFSLTRNVISMWLSVIIILLIFIRVAKKYKGKPHTPRGLQSLIEPLVTFVRDEIINEQLSPKLAERYGPYLMTLFFFIWVNNIIGIIPIFPGYSNVMGNISVTFLLALLTFILTTISGTKVYWKHTLTAPGIPFGVKVILVPVELIGLITKPFALMIRLMANISAGHIIAISLISLIFILKSIFISPISILLGVGMSLLDILETALQAYIFTLLSALYINMSAQQAEH